MGYEHCATHPDVAALAALTGHNCVVDAGASDADLDEPCWWGDVSTDPACDDPARVWVSYEDRSGCVAYDDHGQRRQFPLCHAHALEHVEQAALVACYVDVVVHAPSGGAR
ncbi:MAG: hypothetical protein ACREX8_00240 [Gammaproteobacteria bacterium]